ncbi:uncharacterized protein LOC122724653 [Manihot esculenta]|uniref:uncharacterized protein LOC122724653 n=1 Tax=Manihot esculenta TaxID=3983 RepID=UPI001CC4EF44|nr:uncharacterized protein LOC122724653 [Manihot esculenta]
MGLASGSILCDMLEPEAALAADLMRLCVRVYYILVLLLDLRWALTGLSHPYLYSLFFVVSNSKGPFHGSQGGNQFLKQLAGAGNKHTLQLDKDKMKILRWLVKTTTLCSSITHVQFKK